ncbi:MAG: knotted carbamoyltransferase YgeW, partial [Oscillospiraceae bacterium]
PLSVPQGVIGLFTRFGMDVVLAHPEGYEVMPEIEEIAKKNAAATGGSFSKTNSMEEAFRDADIVYPKSWAPFAAMEKRTKLYAAGDQKGIDALEQDLLAQNAQHKDWACTEERMKGTKDGKALYLHCLPADISGLSCKEGEVDSSVFDRYLVPLYKQASFKPYVIAAMIFMAKVKDPVAALHEMDRGGKRKEF